MSLPRKLAIEAVLTIIGAIIFFVLFKNPWGVIAATSIAIGAAVFLIVDSSEFVRWIKIRFFEIAPLVIGRTRMLWAGGAALIAGALVVLIAWPWAPRILYSTGSFGEPPNNRFLAYRLLSENGNHGIIVNIGVRSFQIDEPIIDIDFGVPLDSRYLIWRDAPHNLTVDSLESRDNLLRLEPEPEEGNGFKLTFQKMRLRPDQSIYILVTSSEQLDIKSCSLKPWFGKAIECGKEIDVTEEGAPISLRPNFQR